MDHPRSWGRRTEVQESSDDQIKNNQITTPYGLEITADTITWFTNSPWRKHDQWQMGGEEGGSFRPHLPPRPELQTPQSPLPNMAILGPPMD